MNPSLLPLGAALVPFVVILVLFEVYVSIYFKRKKFRRVKASIAEHTRNCNQLNDHIEGLKSTFVEVGHFDYGESRLQDTSNFKMKRRNWKSETTAKRVYNCSASVCKNSHNQPYKYLCKYFNIKTNERSLMALEQTLNNFSAAEQGKVLLHNERDLIVSKIHRSIPSLIMLFKRQRVIRELGFNPIDLGSVSV